MANEVKELLEKNKSQLNRYYDFVNTTSSESGFFKAVAEYVRMILNSEVLNGILNIYILSDRDELVKKLNELSQTVLEDSIKVFEEIKKKVKDNKVQNDWVASEITEVENLISGKVKIILTGSGNYSIHFLGEIEDILTALKEGGFKEIYKSYEQTDSANNFKGWKISDSNDELYKLTKKIKEQGQRSVWGAWEKIYWAYATNLKRDETLKQYGKSVHQLDIGSLTNDMDEILSGKRNPNEHNFFANKDEFRESLGLAHLRIIDGIDELIEKTKEENQEEQESRFEYDHEGAMLHYDGNLVFSLHRGKGKSKMFKALWDSKRVIINGSTVEKGKPALLRKDLKNIAGFKSNDNIDKAIAYLRAKLRGLPADLIAEKGFRLVLRG